MPELGSVLTPKLTTAGVELLDTTLRDGSYAVDFQLDEKFVIELLGRLDLTPIRKVELGHGLGLEAERTGITPCNIDVHRWCEIAGAELTHTDWGMFAQPGFSRLSTLAEVCSAGMSFVRIGMEAEQVADNLDYIGQAMELCDQVYLNLMKTSVTPAENLPGLLSGVPSGIAGLYIVDSYGSMLPDDVRKYVTVAGELFDVVGFHGHDNLGMATANSVAAIEAGATIVDGTLNGIGRGAGNAQLESLAGILQVTGEDRFDYKELARLAELCRTTLQVIPDDRNMQVLGGVIGVHSGFFPLIEQLCVKCEVDAASLMETAAGLAQTSVGKNDIHAAAERISRRDAAGASL
ncbi:hypothetical protein [Sphaerimonospora mesophila]|uniref:hypothetical protein n=1 Tax=Sphaerimonospora mesophila TaxID=37483 RepID=UPI0009FA131C